MSNIAEGFRRMSDREFIRFLEVSTSSADEVCSITYAAEDQGYWTDDQVLQIRRLTEKVIALNLGLIRYLLSKEGQEAELDFSYTTQETLAPKHVDTQTR